MSRAYPWLLYAVFASLPLATSVQEVAMALALAAALLSPTRGAFLRAPWARPALAVALVWVAMVPASGNVREGLGHAWLLAPLVAVPALARDEDRDRVVRVGLAAAALAAAWSVAQRVLGAAGTAGMSHHLSLAYALLPPLGVAVGTRRFGVAAVLAAGVLATGSAGAVVALAATVLGSATRRAGWAAVGGVLATVALLPFADAEELRQRAVLWTGGLEVAAQGAVGPGAYAATSARFYDALSPGFWFPNHAHDSAIQVLAVLGPAGLLATAWLCVEVLRRASPMAAAGLAGVLAGALTQDVLGDLEVARAVWAWVALLGATSREPPPPRGY